MAFAFVKLVQEKKTPREYMSSALVKLSLCDRALYYMSLKVEPVETNDPNKTLTLLVHNGSIELVYNPNFVKAIGDAPNGTNSLKTLVGAEMARLLLLHATSRKKKVTPISLLASNLTIYDCFENLKTYNSDKIHQMIPKHTDFGIAKQTTFDLYYEKLLEQIEQQQALLQMIMKESQKLQHENDQGEKENKNEQQKQVETEDEAFERHFNPGKNTNADDWQGDEAAQEEIKNFIINNEELLKEMSKNQGSMLGNLALSIIDAAGKNEINPTAVMRRFLANAESDITEETRTKPNRRRGWFVPGYTKTMIYHVLCGIDGSGSVTNLEAKKLIVEINAMTKIAEIDYITWDTRIYLDSFEKGKKYKPRNNKFKFANSMGGTNPKCLFDFAKKMKYKNVVCLTDGEFCEFDLPGRFKICWITTREISEFMKNTGKVIELKKWKD